MITKKNKITVLIVAIAMFTSTWAGAFAAEPGEPADTDLPAAGQDQDLNVDENDTDPAPGDNNQNAENTAKDGEVSIAAPVAKQDGKSIVVTWEAPEGVEGVTYTVTEQFGEVEKVVYNGTGLSCTLKNKAAGNYMYMVAAIVNGETVATSGYSDPVELVLPDPPDPVTIKEKLSGYLCVQLTWEDVNKAEGYIIYRYTSWENYNANNPEKRIDPSMYTSKDLQIAGNLVTWKNSVNVIPGHDYWYRICAATKVGDTWKAEDVIESTPAVVEKKGCVRPMYITLKLKKKRKLKSLDGGPKITLKKNTTITADGFGGGCYYFTWGNHRYRMARSSAKKQWADYKRGNGDYSPKEAELFVNGLVQKKGLTSKGNYFIWVSFYTQSLYVMERSSNGWKYKTNWDCATGKAATPSPTGDKAIGKKKKKHHNIKWWSSFSNPKSIANSIHGKKKGWKLGLPQSHGCIRNEVANAKWIYDNCVKYTKVYNY